MIVVDGASLSIAASESAITVSDQPYSAIHFIAGSLLLLIEVGNGDIISLDTAGDCSIGTQVLTPQVPVVTLEGAAIFLAASLRTWW